MFVIFGIVQSVAILHYYFVNDIDGDGVDNDLNAGVEKNETEGLINANEDDNGDEYHSDMGQIQTTGVEKNYVFAEEGCQQNKQETEDTQKESDPGIGRKNLKLGTCSSFLVECLLRYKVSPNDSLMKQKVLKLRMWDRATAIFFLFAYTVFLIVMFSIAIHRGGED